MGQMRAARRSGLALVAAVPALLAPLPAAAELAVSQLVVELKPGQVRTRDVEIANNSRERSYVVAEPREILNPGTAFEKGAATPDPARLGLLVSPARFVLEPGQRRTLRVAAIGAPERERVYRVTVKPVAGDVTSKDSGLKLLVGYDLLVMVRPPVIRNDIQAERQGLDLTLTNRGNASVEVTEGRQCDEQGRMCAALPSKRLYAGASWKQRLPRPESGQYRFRSAEGWSIVKF